MRRLYKIFNVCTTIATTAVILCVVFLIGTLYVPRFFGTTPYIVLSGSMEPEIHTGSLVYITKQKEIPGVGEIIAYEAGDVPVVHRIIELGENGGRITKGDANDMPDINPVIPSQILGVCTFVVPKAGYYLSAVRSRVFQIGPVGIPIAALGAVGILVLLYLVQYLIGMQILRQEKVQSEEEPPAAQIMGVKLSCKSASQKEEADGKENKS